MSARGFHQVEEGLDDLCTGAPSPVDLTIAKDDRETLACHLHDRVLKTILTLLMEGDTHAEIARKLGMSRDSVERRIKLIQRMWEKTNPKLA